MMQSDSVLCRFGEAQVTFVGTGGNGSLAEAQVEIRNVYAESSKVLTQLKNETDNGAENPLGLSMAQVKAWKQCVEAIHSADVSRTKDIEDDIALRGLVVRAPGVPKYFADRYLENTACSNLHLWQRCAPRLQMYTRLLKARVPQTRFCVIEFAVTCGSTCGRTAKAIIDNWSTFREITSTVYSTATFGIYRHIRHTVL